MIVKVKDILIKVPTITNPLDLPSIPILAKVTLTKATTPKTMCLIISKPVEFFLGLMEIGHTFKCRGTTYNTPEFSSPLNETRIVKEGRKFGCYIKKRENN